MATDWTESVEIQRLKSQLEEASQVLFGWGFEMHRDMQAGVCGEQGDVEYQAMDRYLTTMSHVVTACNLASNAINLMFQAEAVLEGIAQEQAAEAQLIRQLDAEVVA